MEEVKVVTKENQPIYYVGRSKGFLILNLLFVQAIFVLLVILVVWVLGALLGVAGGLIVTSVILLLLIDAFISVSIYVGARNIRYAFKPGELLVRSGIIQTKEKIHTFTQLETITVRQGFFGRLLNYGTLSIYSPALPDRVIVENIPHPRMYERILLIKPPVEPPKTTE